VGVVFDARADVRVFALFVVLNGAGYDLECGSKGMHHCRIAVREALAGWSSPRKERVRALLARTHSWPFLLWAVNREFGGLPGGKVPLEGLFAKLFLGCQREDPFVSSLVAAVLELDEAAPAALEEVPWQALWAQHRQPHDLQAERYRPAGGEALEQVLRYLRPRNESTHGAVVYVPNLLDSHFTGYAVETGEEVFVVGGPDEEEEEEGAFVELVQHEFAHIVVNPIVYAQTTLLDDTRHLMARLADPTNPYLAPYAHWPTFVAENLVEAVTYIVNRLTSEVLARCLAHSVNVRGLTLVPAFVEALMPHGDGDAPCEEFLPRVLREVLLAVA